MGLFLLIEINIFIFFKLVETNGESSLENDRINNNKNIDHHARINHHRQENLLAIRSDMELNLAKLLGFDSIDYSHIGYIFDDDQCKYK